MAIIELINIEGKKHLKKEVDNISVYYQLSLIDFFNVPKIIKIEGDYVYYEFIEGDNLMNCLTSNKFDLKQRIALGLQLINGIKIINENNIIHKDIKPENIIYGIDNKIYFIDFGASRLYTKDKSRDTTLLGTENYASPEHYGYQQTTFKSDMYSMGKVLADLKLPSEYDELIKKCTQINPDDRYDDYNLLISDYINIYKQYNKPIVNSNETEFTDLFAEKKKDKEVFNSKSIFPYQEFGYCFDNSKGQYIFTIVCAVFYLLSLIGMWLTQPISDESPILYFGIMMYLWVLTSYFIDCIRITIKRLSNKSIKLIKYYGYMLLNISLAFGILFIIAAIDIIIKSLG